MSLDVASWKVTAGASIAPRCLLRSQSSAWVESPAATSSLPSLEKLREKAGWSRTASVIQWVSKPVAVSQTQTRGI